MSIAPPGPPPPPPPKGDPTVVRQAQVIPHQSTGRTIYEPQSMPVRPMTIIEESDDVGVVGSPKVGPGGAPWGSDTGVLHSLLSDTARYTPQLKPPDRPVVERPKQAAATSPTDKPRRVSQVQLATPLHKVEPVYPTLAKQAGISGTVELMGVLGVDGRIHELRVVSGHPLLIKAAMDAVKQWVFAPTTLNGEPVEVQAPIQVNFILKR
jgi:protein TonB